MLRVKVVCVEPNTPKDSPKRDTIELPPGILTEVKILIPPGHQALAGVRVKYGLENVVPYRQDDWVRGDFVTITDTPDFRLENDPTVLAIEAYNEDDTYEHCFYMYFTVKREEELTTSLLSKFLKWLGFRG